MPRPHTVGLVVQRWGKCPGYFTPGTHCTGFWKGPITGLDVLEKRKYVAPSRNQVPG